MASRSSDPARSTCISSTPRTRPATSARRASSPERSRVRRLGCGDNRAQDPVGDVVGRRDRDVGHPDGRQAFAELGDAEGTGDAARVRAALEAFGRRQAVLGDDVGDADAAPRPQDARDLAEDRRLVGGQVHDAVADHDVDRIRGQRDRLDVALEELDVGGLRLGGVALGKREHLVGHVQPEGAAGRPDPLGGQQDVDPATRPEIEDPFALAEVGDGGRVAATERRQDGSVRKLAPVKRGIQLRTDWVRPPEHSNRRATP